MPVNAAAWSATARLTSLEPKSAPRTLLPCSIVGLFPSESERLRNPQQLSLSYLQKILLAFVNGICFSTTDATRESGNHRDDWNNTLPPDRKVRDSCHRPLSLEGEGKPAALSAGRVGDGGLPGLREAPLRYPRLIHPGGVPPPGNHRGGGLTGRLSRPIPSLRRPAFLPPRSPAPGNSVRQSPPENFSCLSGHPMLLSLRRKGSRES